MGPPAGALTVWAWRAGVACLASIAAASCAEHRSGGDGAGGAGGSGGTADEDLARLVDPFIGTASFNGLADNDGFNTGNTFPGATFPFGMVQLSPDNSRAPGGYRYGSDRIDAFSLTHFSGRGISCWQDIGVLPWMGAPFLAPASLAGRRLRC